MRALTDAELDVVSGGRWKKSYAKPGVFVVKDNINIDQEAEDTGNVYIKVINPHGGDVYVNGNTGNQAVALT